MDYIILCMAALAVLFGMFAVYDAAKQRQVDVTLALMIGFFATPICGLLYCLCSPPKAEEE